ncbi:MAG TPA: DUF6452 family protein [Prolixibacteraceae bacterium]|jgi:hypothetical protein
MKRLIGPILILLFVIGCKEVFEAPPQAILRATFYNDSTNLAMSPTITVIGVGRDSLLYNEEVRSNVLLPLTHQDTTRYIIWLDSKADSLIFVHQATKKYASVETGFYYEYKLLSVRFTHTRIDSLKIIDSLVTTKWNENIKLYIHPLPAGGK